MKFCPECGQRLIAEEKEAIEKKPQHTRSATLTIERAEPTYYSDEKGVRITPTRLIIGSTTYTMANITSIKTKKDEPNRHPGIITSVIGIIILAIFAAMGESAGVVFGVLVLGGGIAWAWLVKPTYHLTISSASGEPDALSSKSEEYVKSVATALNEALIKRG